VLVLLDDFSLELLPTMRRASAMADDGAVFEQAYVVDSLCCPSRAATLSGLPPHLNGVRTNSSGGPYGAQGGFAAFAEHGNLDRTVNVSLQQAGYRTGFVGKYLNEYEPTRFGGTLPLLPGWTDVEAFTGGAYNGWGYDVFRRVGDELVADPHPRPDAEASTEEKDEEYATTVLADRAVRLARRYERAGDPYFLYVAPYATHESIDPAWPDEPPFPPAFRDRPGGPAGPDGDCGARDCGSLGVADLPGFGDDTDDNLPVLRTPDGLEAAESWRLGGPMAAATAEEHLRDRARMAQSVDRMLGRLRRAVGDDAYIVLTSDNGFHLGQHGLMGGKGTPYDSDVHVPLLVTGPGIEPGGRAVVTTNLDLAPTIEELAGATPAGERAGSSVAPALWDRRAEGPAYAFVEHTHGPVLPGEPDADAGTGGRLDAIPSYVAVRSARGLLVRLDVDDSWEGEQHAWELYDYEDVGWERTNVYAERRREPWARDLARRLRAWDGCAPEECRRLTLPEP
jgi:arylsulfatase A-like enzyme